MDCQAFVTALNLVSGSLDKSDLIPIFSHICFDVDRFYSYNDRVATIVDFSTELNCAVKGDQLLKLLDPLTGKLTLDQSENYLTITVRPESADADFVASVPTLPPNQFIFEDPYQPKNPHAIVELNADIIQAFEIAAKHVVKDYPLQPSLGGVNLLMGKSGLAISATDNMTMVHFEMPASVTHHMGGFRERIVIPIEAVKQMVRLAKAGKKIHEKRILATVGDFYFIVMFDGTTRLVSKLLPAKPAIDFWRVCETFIKEVDDWIELRGVRPSPASQAIISTIERASKLCRGNDRMEIEMSGEQMSVSAETGDTVLGDIHRLNFVVEKPFVVKVSAQRLAETPFHIVDEMGICSRGVCFRGAGSTFLVAGGS